MAVTPKSLDFEYNTPPVTEVVVSVQFEDIVGFNTIHFGAIAADFKEQGYTGYQETIPLPKVSLQGESVSPFLFNTSPFLPRVWFIKPEDSSLVQFQRDRFCFNWRKEQQKYPGYETIIGEFTKQYDVLLKAISKLKLPVPTINALELTYINTIPTSEFGSLETVHNALQDINWKPKENLPAPAHMQANFQFLLKSDVQLYVNFSTAHRINNKEKLLQMEQRAVKQIKESTLDLHLQFEEAHNAIIYGFEGLLSETIKKKWGKKHA